MGEISCSHLVHKRTGLPVAIYSNFVRNWQDNYARILADYNKRYGESLHSLGTQTSMDVGPMLAQHRYYRPDVTSTLGPRPLLSGNGYDDALYQAVHLGQCPRYLHLGFFFAGVFVLNGFLSSTAKGFGDPSLLIFQKWSKYQWVSARKT